MDTILITLATLGFGIVALAIYLLALLSSRADSSFERRAPMPRSSLDRLGWRERSPVDRRRHRSSSFPMIINGVLVEKERRVLADRRMFS